MKNFIYVIGLLPLSKPGIIGAQEISLSTDVSGYLDTGTINMEISAGDAGHLTVKTNLRNNPFTFLRREDVADRVHSRLGTLTAGARFWAWHILPDWWLCVKTLYQKFNQLSLAEAETRESDRLGRLAGGYTYMFSPHINNEADTGFKTVCQAYV